MSKPKVYFFGGEYQGCWYVRCLLPMMANGWTGVQTGIAKKTRKSASIIRREMLNADVIVFHRADTNWHHRLGMELRAMGKKIVFDNDDTNRLDEHHSFVNLDERGFEQNKERLNNVTNNFILNADMVTCSTEYLAKEYSENNKNVVVLPNYVNPEDWDTPKRNAGDKVRIGLVGSVIYHHDFEVMAETIKRLDKDDRVQLVLFGLWSGSKRSDNPLVEEVHRKEYEFWDGIKNKEHVAWCDMENYFDQLNDLELDMMLIPRRDNYFSRCKSNVKFLEAAMCEVPVIATGLGDGSYDKDIDGTNGILVPNNEGWDEAITSLVTDKEKRRDMGKNAHEYVLKNYNINDHAHKWVEAYNTLCEK